MPDLQDQLAISALMQSWALARDTGDWGKLRATAHPGAAMTTTWFDGSFDAFVESCEASWRKGSRSQHFLGGTVAEIEGTRAIAQTRMSINVRALLDGVEVDAVCTGRFFDRVEKLVRQLFDPRPEILNDLAREGRPDERAQADVVRAVLHEHPIARARG